MSVKIDEIYKTVFYIIIANLVANLCLCSCSTRERKSRPKKHYGKELKHQFINYDAITKDSVDRYERLASQGDAESMFMLANCLARGVWCKQDSLKAITYLRKAAVAGDYDAQMRICEVYHFKDYYFFEHRDYASIESPIDTPYDLWGAGYAYLDYINDQNVKQTHSLADKGEAWAQVLVGHFYNEDDILVFLNHESDNSKALKWYRKAAYQGFAWGQAYADDKHWYSRRDVHWNGEPIYGNRNAAAQGCRWALSELIKEKENVDTLFKYCFPVFNTDTTKYLNIKADSINVYQQGVKLGDSQYELQLGLCYCNGIGVQPNTNKGWELVKKSAHKGNSRASNYLAMITNNECKRAKFFFWYEAARQGHAYALTSCGHSLVQNNFNLANYFYKEAIKRDSTDLWILKNIGYSLYDNQHAGDAYYYLDKSVQLGCKDSGIKYRLGQCYYHGWGVKKDYTKALQYFHEVQEKEPLAKTYIGFCYENGQGVEQNLPAALEWYRKGEASNNALACYRLGLCYEYGRGVPYDMGKAVEYYRIAADGKIMEALMHLAECYNSGKGVPKDTIEAIEWYKKASEQGNEYADTQLPQFDYEQYERERIDSRTSLVALVMGFGEIINTPRNWDMAKANFSVWVRKANFFVFLILFGLFFWLLWAIVRGIYRLFNPNIRFAGKEYRVIFEDDNNEIWLFSDCQNLLVTSNQDETKLYTYTIEKNRKLRINNYRGHNITLLSLQKINFRFNTSKYKKIHKFKFGEKKSDVYFFLNPKNEEKISYDDLLKALSVEEYAETVSRRLEMRSKVWRNMELIAILIGVLISVVIYAYLDSSNFRSISSLLAYATVRETITWVWKKRVIKRILKGYTPKKNAYLPG